MHARVTTITGSPEQAEQGISSFRDDTLPAIMELEVRAEYCSSTASPGTLWQSHSGRTKRRCEQARSERTSYAGWRPSSWVRPGHRASIDMR